MYVYTNDPSRINALDFESMGLNPHPIRSTREAQINAELKELEDYKFDDAQIYDATMAGYQDDFFGEALIKMGFEKVFKTTNPNTSNRIVYYVRRPR